MSPSSVEVTSRPAGAGHRARTAIVDLARIPDPEAWLTNRLGPLASFDLRAAPGAEVLAPNLPSVERLDTLASRLAASMQAVLAKRRTTFDALAARLDAAAPSVSQSYPKPKAEKYP